MEIQTIDVATDLIFDIGMHCGDDTAYYLHKGYRVLGIEANPLLTADCSLRFKDEINQGRLKILNSGVLKNPGSFIFFRNLTDNGWSTFDPARGMKGGEWEEIKVECVTTQHLIELHGKPFFIKIDIEGADIQAIQSLTAQSAPPYVSLELSYADPIIEALINIGYNSFKFISGESFQQSIPIFEHEIGWRLLRKAGRIAPVLKSMIGSLANMRSGKSEWNPPGQYSPDGYQFTAYSSGPFGEQAAGKWKSAESAIEWFRALKENYHRAGQEDSLWWDVHARHSSFKD